MTNKEAAEHFAALPPDEDAIVLIIDGDNAMGEECTIDETGQEFLDDQCDNAEDLDPKHPHIYRKW